MPLRLPCERCAVVQPTRAMALSPSGAGYVCWRCELSAQVAEHEAALGIRRERPWLWTALVAVAVLVALTLLGAWTLLATLGRIC